MKNLFALILSVLLFTGLSQAQSITVTPSYATIGVSSQVQYVAAVTGLSNASVTWEVNGIKGGNSTVGTISPTGIYTSPAKVPSGDTLIIALGSDGKTSGVVYVNIEPVGPSISSISPNSLTPGNYTITINGTGFLSGANVYNGSYLLATKFVSSTQLIASGYQSSTNPGVFQVANPNTLPGPAFTVSFGGTTPPPPPFTISPTTATVALGTTQQFTAAGATSWTTTAGTISSTGLYTAPAPIPATATVTATGPSGTVTATVTLGPSSAGTPVSPTITFAVANQTSGAAPFTVAATSNSTGALTYSVVSGPATVSGSTVTLTGTGTVVLKVSQAAAGNYTAGTQTATFTVSAVAPPPPVAPTITFSVPNQTSGAAPFTVAATSNSTGALTYSVVSGPATVSGSTVTLTGTGTVVLKASQVAAGSYTAGSQTASFTVTAVTPPPPTTGTWSQLTLPSGVVANGSEHLFVVGSNLFVATKTGSAGSYVNALYTATQANPNVWSGNIADSNLNDGNHGIQSMGQLADGTVLITMNYTASTNVTVYYWNGSTTASKWTSITGWDGVSSSSIYAFPSDSKGYTYFSPAWSGDVWRNDAPSSKNFTKVFANLYSLVGSSGGIYQMFIWDLGDGNGDMIWACGEGGVLNVPLTFASATQYFAGGTYTGNCYGLDKSTATILAARTADVAGDAINSIAVSNRATATIPAAGPPSSYPPFGDTNNTQNLLHITGTTWAYNTTAGGTTYLLLSQDEGKTWSDLTTGLGSSCTGANLSERMSATSTAIYARCQGGKGYWQYSVSGSTPTLTSPTISFSVANQTSGATPFTVSATSNSTGALTYSVVSGPATISGSTVTLTGTGTVVLQVSQAAAGTYTTGTQTASFTVSAVTPPPGNISVTIQSPLYGWQVIPGATRRIHANVANGGTDQVSWLIVKDTSGGATITPAIAPNIVGAYADITVGKTGSACTETGTTTPVITSNSVVTVEVTSVEDPTKSITFPIYVCNPTVGVYISPFNSRVYQGQTVDLQSWVWGAVNDNVTWSITTQPSGGNGVFIAPPAGGSSSTARDALFSATVAGNYTLTATSVSDNTKSATAIVSVSSNALPSYAATPNHTRPVDCSVDPSQTGKTYAVGTGHPYATLAAVYAAIGSNITPVGTTIQLWNTDTTGTNPTRYHEYLRIDGQGTQAAPIRVVGCADAAGNLPILDASNATSYSPTDNSVAAQIAGLYQIGFHHSNGFATYPTINSPSYIIIEGLAFRNAYPTVQPSGTTNSYYYAPGSSTQTQWLDSASCIRPYEGNHVTIRGNDMQDCSFGVLADFNGNNGWGGFFGDFDLEGNYFANIGASNESEHMAYVQGFRQVIQGNYFDTLKSVSAAGELKMRGVAEIVRYNVFNTTTNTRTIDFVEEQDSNMYMSTLGYYYPTNGTSFHMEYPADTYTPDMIAAGDEAWHKAYAYGNIVNFGPNTPSSEAPIHFFGDQSPYADQNTNPPVRVGNLFDYSNTFYSVGGSAPGGPPNFNLVDTMQNEDNQIRWEWPSLTLWNNAIYSGPLDNTANQGFQWSTTRADTYTFGPNWISSNWGNNNQNCTTITCWAGTGWPWYEETTQYMDGGNLPAHISGFSNVIVGGTTVPFSTSTWAATTGGGLVNAGSALPSTISNMPVRFQFSGYALKPRVNPLTLGAHD